MKSLVLVVFLLLTGCLAEPGYPEPPPPPNTDLCGKMCEHLVKLGCEEGNAVYDIDTPGPPDVPNVTCTAFCERLQKNGVFVNPKCVIPITSCEDIEPSRQKDPATCGVN